MAKRYVLISANLKTNRVKFVKTINDLLLKGYELYGSPQINVIDDKENVHQALTIEK